VLSLDTGCRATSDAEAGGWISCEQLTAVVASTTSINSKPTSIACLLHTVSLTTEYTAHKHAALYPFNAQGCQNVDVE